MITYETLRRIEQEEKNSVKLAKLPPRFLQEVMDYLEKKESIAREKGVDWECQTSKQRFNSIMQLRERKILNFTLSFVRSGAVPEDMLPEERELFDSIARNLQDFQGKREKAMSGEKVNMRAVAFLRDMSQFVGIDTEYYGPYKAGDIATVPEDNAKLIVEKGAGELVEPG
jgi:DNA replication initiation complex subunit (GINS family)